MMRLLFGILLLVSIGLFALMQWGGTLTGASKNAHMLAELNPDKIKLLDRPVPAESAVLAVHSAVAASTPAAAEPLTAGLPASAALAATAVPSVTAPPKIGVAAAPAVPVTVPSHSPAPEKIVLPSPPTAALASLPVPAVVRAPAPAAAPPVKAASYACMEWGEFSGADLARATKALAALNLGDRLKRRTVEYDSGYWVYMPSLKNKAAVNRKIAQIKALGVEDFYVVNEPAPGNVISLGVFKTREAAVSYLASLKKKGIRTAIVGERKQKLKYIAFEFKRMETEAVAQLHKLQKDYAYSELKTLPCNN